MASFWAVRGLMVLCSWSVSELTGIGSRCTGFIALNAALKLAKTEESSAFPFLAGATSLKLYQWRYARAARRACVVRAVRARQTLIIDQSESPHVKRGLFVFRKRRWRHTRCIYRTDTTLEVSITRSPKRSFSSGALRAFKPAPPPG